MSQSPTISEAGRAYLRLHLSEGVGPITLRRLLERFGGAEAALRASTGELRMVQRVGHAIADAIRRAARSDDADREIELAEQHGVRILCPKDDEYPPLLEHVPDGPICLYVRGRLERQDGVSLAVVGCRRPSYYGQEQATQLAHALANTGLTIVSGLAYGVDACAHRGALDAGGRTVAVLGNGLADVYPPAHRDLSEQIAASGAVVSEFPMKTGPEPGNFPRRNRIIAGMSLGSLVIEGGERSGALITARLANDYNREVFALPGRSDAPTSHGPNLLIRTGMARLVTRADDVLDELGPIGSALRGDPAPGTPANLPPARMPPLGDIERQTLDTLDHEPMPIEAIADTANLSAAEVASALTTLQLKRLVKQLPGSVFVRIDRG